MADLLNSHFKSVFEADTFDPLPEFKKRTENLFELNQILSHLNETEIERRLKALKVNKSMRIDGVHPMVLSECAAAFATPLVILFRKSLMQNKIPNLWKLALISPIFKKGSRTLAANYRPISLTSIVCKLLESIIRDEFLNHLILNKLLNPAQHGFVPHRSCLSNLLETLDFITASLADGLNVDEVLLDFAKAFALVPYRR